MKFNKALLSATIISVCFASSSMAESDGVINFEGELTANTCRVTVDGSSTSPAIVTLPTVSIDTLKTAGATTGATGFKIGLSDCVGVTTTTTAAAFFENGSTVDTNTAQLLNTAPTATAAENVQLQLLDDSNAFTKINIGNQDQTANTTHLDLSSGTVTLPYSVRYYATGLTSPGLVQSQVNFSIDYQ